MIRQGLTQMNMIANARVFPDVEDADDEDSIPLHNLLVLIDKRNVENLRISKAAWNSVVDTKKKRKNATDGQVKKARKTQLEYSPSQYKVFEEEMKALDDLFVPGVFSRDILEEVDSIYYDIFRTWNEDQRDAHMLDTSSQEFQGKMEEYDRDVTAKLKSMWREVRRRTGTTLTDDEMAAFKNAEDKLDWIMLLRKRGHYARIPFPTRTFIVHSLDRLKTPAKGFQSVSLNISVSSGGTLRAYAFARTPIPSRSVLYVLPSAMALLVRMRVIVMRRVCTHCACAFGGPRRRREYTLRACAHPRH